MSVTITEELCVGRAGIAPCNALDGGLQWCDVLSTAVLCCWGSW